MWEKLPRQSAPQLMKMPGVYCHDYVIGGHKRQCVDHQNMPNNQIFYLSCMNMCMSGGNEKAIAK